MSEIESSVKKMKGLMFRASETTKGDRVRVQLKDFDGVLKVRKWNYREKRWGAWARMK